eukprot:gi/632984372/ref/XP_007909108.1/ PREDICTED: relaxin-3 isoform X4 [Callorhinchus milii]
MTDQRQEDGAGGVWGASSRPEFKVGMRIFHMDPLGAGGGGSSGGLWSPVWREGWQQRFGDQETEDYSSDLFSAPLVTRPGGQSKHTPTQTPLGGSRGKQGTEPL